MLDCTTFILCGGKSSRMGQEKAFLKVGRRLLIDHAIFQARAVGAEFYLVGPRDKFAAYGRTVQDIFPETGPLGGIHAGLKKSTTELNLVFGVDTPFIRHEYLRELIDIARHNDCMVTVSQAAGRIHPLCGVYRRAFAAVAEHAIKAAHLKLENAFPTKGTCIVDVRRTGYDPDMFENVNTPEDLERAREFLAARETEAKWEASRPI